MNQWAMAVQQFGEQTGAPDLMLGSNGRFSITVGSGRRIAGEVCATDLLVYALDPAPYDGAKRLLRAWRRAYLSRLEGRPIQTALCEQNNQFFLLAVVRLSAEECSAYTLRAGIDLVSRWLDDTSSP